MRALFEFLLLLSGALVLISLNSRASYLELSRTLTSYGCIGVGVSLMGLTISAPGSTSMWPAVEAWLGLMGFIAGLAIAIIGVVRLRRARDEDESDPPDHRADVMTHWRHRKRASTSPTTRNDPTVRERMHRRGWLCIATGALILLLPLLVSASRDSTLDGSPRGNLLLGAIVLGGLLILLGHGILNRSVRVEDD